MPDRKPVNRLGEVTQAVRMSVALDDSFVGTSIGELKVVCCLGEGEACVVYEAWDPAGNRRAVRVFKPVLARVPGFLARLTAVSQKLITVRLPGIAAHHGVGTLEDGQPYAVMECVDGESLASWTGRKGPAPIADVLTFGVNLCRALQPLHALGHSHGGLGPEHVFLVSGDPTGAFKVIGAGMPRTAPSTDLQGLGRCLYRLLTGRDAADGADPSALRPDTPRPLASLTQALLSDDPAARPTSADAVARALLALAEPPEQAALPAAPPTLDGPFHTTAEILAQAGPERALPKPPRPIREADDEPEPAPRRLRTPLIAGGVLAVALLAVFWARRSPPVAVEAPKAVAPAPAAVRAPEPAPAPTSVTREVPTVRELAARTKALTQELKRRPETTYSARTDLRKLVRRSEANPDATERAAIAADLDLWEQTYLPRR